MEDQKSFLENLSPSKAEELLKIDEKYYAELIEQIESEKDEKMLDYLGRQKVIVEERMIETKKRIAGASK